MRFHMTTTSFHNFWRDISSSVSFDRVSGFVLVVSFILQPPLVSYKLDKNLGNFLVRSSLKTEEQPGSFQCPHARYNTCLFVQNTVNISGPKQSVKITDRFYCTCTNVIYCITCNLCKMLYIGETGRRLGDRFREHLRDVKNNDKDVSKPVSPSFVQRHDCLWTFPLSRQGWKPQKFRTKNCY